MKIKGISHITLSCKNLDKSFDFYHTILKLKPLVKWERGAYFLAGDIWFCLSLDLGPSPLKGKGHISFDVDQDNFRLLKERLYDFKVTNWTENKSEGDSFYFLDPDGNQLEIHVGSWESRIKSIKQNPYPGKIDFYV